MRFIRLILLLWLLVAILIGGATRWGMAQIEPNELQARGFDMCGSRSCFIGITPGITTWSEAKTILTKWGHPIKSDDDFSVSIGSVEVDISSLNSYVDSMNIIGIPNGNFVFPSVGSFVAKYGPPCRLLFNGDPNYIELAYPSMMLRVFRGNQTQLELDMPIYNVNLRDLSRLSIDPLDFCTYNKIGGPGIIAWSGFASGDYYKAHGLSPD